MKNLILILVLLVFVGNSYAVEAYMPQPNAQLTAVGLDSIEQETIDSASIQEREALNDCMANEGIEGQDELNKTDCINDIFGDIYN